MASSQLDPASRTPQSSSPQARVRIASQWLALVGAGLALLGLGAGLAGCARPVGSLESAKPAYSDQQVADAKKAVCDAYAKGMRTVRSVASRRAESEADKLPVITISATGELAAAQYFLNVLSSNPATPSDIEQPLSKLAQQYQEVALIQLANGAPSEYRENGEKIDKAVSEIDKSCQ